MKRLTKDLRGRCWRKATIYFLVCCLILNTSVSTLLALEAVDMGVNSGATPTQWGAHTIIDTEHGAIINWNTFDTIAGDIVQFNQSLGGVASSASAVLNRITSASATQFDGALNANGRVFVVNPAGIIFGAGSTVDVTQLVASGLNITDSDFMNGIYRFSGGNGTVINYGDISAQQVTIIGKQVLNAGTITSPDGYVIMAAGERAFLGQQGSDIVVEIDSVTLPEQGQTEGIGDVINEGTVEAAGGTIVLAAGDTFSRAVHGLDSLSVAVEGGTGRVGQFGTLNVDSADGDGGSITLTAGDVVALGEDSLTTANAGSNGDGGEVIAYSPGAALFRNGARVEAKGGSESGDGGFVEVSGIEHVEVLGLVDASATNGQSGTFLIDPTDITIVDSVGTMDPGAVGVFTPSGNTSTVSDDAIETFLDGGTSVVINTASGGTANGDIIQNADAQINKTTDNGDVTLTLTADNNIELNGGIISASDAGILNVNMAANGDITTSADIDLNGGAAKMVSGVFGSGVASDLTVNGNITAGSITLQGGDPADPLNFDRNLTATGQLHSTVGDVTVSGEDQVTLSGDIMADNGSIYATADSDNIGGYHLSTEGLSAPNGDIELIGRNVDVKGAASAGGKLTIRAMADVGWGGGTMHAEGNLQAGGNLDISVRASLTDDTIDSSGQITLDGDAIAGGDLSLHNNTDMTAAGAKLEAGNNVIFANSAYPTGYDGACDTLVGNEDLTIRAGAGTGVNDGQIYAENTTITVTGSFLTLDQDVDLDLADFLFGNQGNTDLTLISNNGSVTATDLADGGKDDNAADRWTSIGATADTGITLSGNTGNITTRQLTSATGDIDVDTKAVAAQLLATEAIEATAGSVILTAAGGIDADGNITAGTNINLSTTNGGDISTGALTIKGGQSSGEIKVDADGGLTVNGAVAVGSAVDPIDNDVLGGNAEARVHLESGGDMLLNGTVTAHAHTTSPGDATASVRILPGQNGVTGDVTINQDLVATANSDDGTSYALVEVDAFGQVTWGADADATATADSEQVLGVRVTEDDLGDPDEAHVHITDGDPLPDLTGVIDDYLGNHMGSAVTGNVLGNDLDVGGHDIDVASHTDPANGTLTSFNGETGVFTYTPNAGFTGTDTFQYTATDGVTTTGPVTVTIQMSNTLPVLVDDVATTNEGVLVAGNVLTNDVDEDPLTAALGSGPSNAASFTLNLDGSFSYTPADGFVGEDSFTYSASDPQVVPVVPASGPATVTITVNAGPAPPTPTPPSSQMAPPAAPGVDVRVVPEISGFPALIKWVAKELGVDEKAINVWFANALASARDIPPYDAYSNFKKAAKILQDGRGTHADALAQVINEFAASTAPPTEEQMASIAEALARNTDPVSVYARADSYLDSLAEYVAFLVSEMDFAEEDAVKFVTTKYVDQLAEEENVGLAAYVAARLATLYEDRID